MHAIHPSPPRPRDSMSEKHAVITTNRQSTRAKRKGSLSFSDSHSARFHSTTLSPALVSSKAKNAGEAFQTFRFQSHGLGIPFVFPIQKTHGQKLYINTQKSSRAGSKEKCGYSYIKYIYSYTAWSTNTHAYKDSKFTNLLFYYLSGERERIRSNAF